MRRLLNDGQVGSTSKMDTLDKGTIHVPEQTDGMTFHPTIQNRSRFKTYGLFISGIFYLMFSDHH